MREPLNPAGNRTLIFMGERYKCENYKECWFKYCELVFAGWGKSFNQVFTYDSLIWHFKKDPSNSGGKQFRLIKGTDIYVDCNLSFDTIKDNMKTMDNAFGYKSRIE